LRPLSGFEVRAPHRGRDSSGADANAFDWRRLDGKPGAQPLEQARLVVQAAQIEHQRAVVNAPDERNRQCPERLRPPRDAAAAGVSPRSSMLLTISIRRTRVSRAFW
jgi:hypothetical protein